MLNFGLPGLDVDDHEFGRQRVLDKEDFVETDGRVNIRALPADTPAYEQGLNANDQIVAIDGNRASIQFINTYISERKPGDKVKLTIFRFDQLRDIDFTLGTNTRKEYSFIKLDNVTDEQKKIYRGYMNADL